MKQRNPTRPFLIAPICLAALLLGLTCADASAQDCNANAKLSLGSATAMSGLVQVELRGSSMCDVTGFALAIGHDVTRVEFVNAEPGPFFVNYADEELEFLAGAAEDFTHLLLYWLFTTVPPTDIENDTLLATLTYRILPGAPLGPMELRNETNTFGRTGFPKIPNIFTSATQQIDPVLESGVITIGQPETYSMSLDATVDSEIVLQLTGSSSKPLRAFSAFLTFDPSVLAVASVNQATLTDEAFAATVWESSMLNGVTLGDGTIEIQAARLSPWAPVAPGVDLPFLYLTFEVLSCAGDTTVTFEDRGISTNQFVDADFGIHDATTDLAVEDITIPLGGGGASGFIRGNANGGIIDLADPVRSVDLADAIFMLQSLFMGGQAPPCADAADANDDGRYNLLDPITVIQFLIGNAGSTLPGPFTEPGDDPTSDTLGCETLPKSTCVEL